MEKSTQCADSFKLNSDRIQSATAVTEKTPQLAGYIQATETDYGNTKLFIKKYFLSMLNSKKFLNGHCYPENVVPVMFP